MFSVPTIQLSLAAEKPIPTTICDILAAPNNFQNKLVKVSASVKSDGTHFTMLIDRVCPKLGFTPQCPDTNPHCSGMAKIHGAVYKGHPGTIDKEVSGAFVGKVDIRAKGIPKWVIYIEDVSDLISTLKPE